MFPILTSRGTHLCIPDADLLIPRHNKMIKPVMASEARNRVRVTRTSRARQGGSLALADFHVTPPLGSNIFRDEEERKGGRSEEAFNRPGEITTGEAAGTEDPRRNPRTEADAVQTRPSPTDQVSTWIARRMTNPTRSREIARKRGRIRRSGMVASTGS